MVSKAPLTQPAFNTLNWNTPLNSNFGITSNALGAIAPVSVASTDYVLSSSEAEHMGISVTGTKSANINLLLPAGIVGSWILKNGTTGAYTLTIYVNNGAGAPAGVGVELPTTALTIVMSDGTNVYSAGSYIAPGSVGTTQLANGAVTTAKLADASVTTAKIVDANVTTAKIADANVTTAKIADANITPAKLNGAQSGSAPIYGVRAWGRVDSSGALSYGGNIASAVRNGVGNFSVVFTTAMANANYAVVVTPELAVITRSATIAAKSASGFTVYIGTDGGNPDSTAFSFMVIQ